MAAASSLNSSKKFLIAIYRAIWQLGIVVWLNLAFYLAARSTDHHLGRVFSLLLPYLLFEGLHIYSEYQKPNPTLLGISDPRSARWQFPLAGLVGSLMWLVFSWPDLSGWPKLIPCAALVYLAYLLRPRLPRPKKR